MDDVRFAVTGATGWLGRAACEVLAGSPLQAFASRARTLQLDAGPSLDVRPLEELAEAEFDVLLHYAYVTREQIGDDVDAYIAANVAITSVVLDAVARAGPRAVVFASSGAAVTSDDPYARLKAADELAFRRAAARSLILRVYNVAGPWIRKPEAFALSDLIRQARAGGPLVIRAQHPVLRSYVDVEDLARIAVGWSLDPTAGDDVVVETAGDEVIEVGDLASRITQVLGTPDLPIHRDWDPAAPPDRYIGDPTTFTSLTSHLSIPLRTLDEQITRT